MKSKFIKSTIILIIGGLITKLLGMFIKIVLTRTIKEEGISLYMLILPTFNLFITLCTLGLSPAISKLISEKKRKSKNIILSLIPLVIIYNLILIILIIIISPLLSNILLQNSNTYYPIIAIGLTLPFICISSIIKGYYFGKERMFPHTLSNIIEQLTRLLLTITYIPKLLNYGIVYSVTGVVLINIISEFISIIILLLFLPKNEIITIEDYKIDKIILKDILSISIPSTGSRLIGSIVYFFEPIILTFILKYVGYDYNYITLEYGIINGYVYPLLLMPSFFTLAISNALLPVISNNYTNNRKEYSKNKLKQAITFSLIIGIPFTLIFILIPNIPLNLIYKTTSGLNYIPYLAPFFLLYYVQSPLTSTLQGMGKAKEAMYGTLIGSLIKTISLIILSFLKIGLWSLLISNILNILYVTIQHYYVVHKYLN